jgi:hypothetical protein
MVTAFSGPGKAIYVMGRTGNIHLSSHSVGYRHHSSLSAGTSVAGAGELQVEDGRLKWISNKSGHYAPSVVHLVQTLHQLQKRGVPMFFRLKLVPDNQEFATVGEFLDKMELGEQDYELAKLTAYMQHMDEATLGENGWRWRNESERAGVYTIDASLPVPHKQVRQWLKSKVFERRQKRNWASSANRQVTRSLRSFGERAEGAGLPECSISLATRTAKAAAFQ